MRRRTRIWLLIAASWTCLAASIPADGTRSVLFGVAGASFGLAALLTIKGGAR